MDNLNPERCNSSRQGRIALTIILSVLVIDQIIKILVKTGMSLGESIEITSWFKILFVENNGMAFGMEIIGKLFLSLFRLYSTCQQVNSGLLAMQQRVQKNQTQSASTQSALENTYEEYALLIGQNLEKYPEYANKEHLQAICDYIGAEYIMLFDSNGDETMSNSRYVNLSLGNF